MAAHTRHVTIGTPSFGACEKVGGTSFGPMGEAIARAKPAPIVTDGITNNETDEFIRNSLAAETILLVCFFFVLFCNYLKYKKWIPIACYYASIWYEQNI